MNEKSLYIHIPFCISKCRYCDFFSEPVSEVSGKYTDALINELTFRLKNEKSLRSVYIGGGTPSLLSEKQLKLIAGLVIPLNPHEFTIEVNPDDVTKEFLSVLAECGVSRLSCGIQSLNNKCLEFCKRRAKREQVIKALELLNRFWQGDLSLDLISALPYETEESFLEGLEILCRSKADHISLYSLTIEEETPFGKMLSSGELDYDFEKADEMWLKGRDFLEAHGFSQYEVSNFCRKEKESIHNLAYWNHQNYIGCGSGATGTFYNTDGTAFRWTNTTHIPEYINFWNGNSSGNEPVVSENLDRETEVFEFFMMGLRKLSGVSRNHFISLFNTALPESVEKQFQAWRERGLSEIETCNGDVIYRLNKKGILLLNRFLSELELPEKI